MCFPNQVRFYKNICTIIDYKVLVRLGRYGGGVMDIGSERVLIPSLHSFTCTYPKEMYEYMSFNPSYGLNTRTFLWKIVVTAKKTTAAIFTHKKMY